MKTKFKLIIGLLFMSSFLAPVEGFSQSFNKAATIWWPLESSDYNEAFKRAFLDIESFISSTGATEIGSGWTINSENEVVLVVTVVVTAAAQEDMYEMIGWYNNLAATCTTCSADYKRGLEDGANTWYSMPLTWGY